MFTLHLPSLPSYPQAIPDQFRPKARLLPYEAEMINRVQEQGAHEGVVALLDADLDARPAWLKYEYVPGGEAAR